MLECHSHCHVSSVNFCERPGAVGATSQTANATWTLPKNIYYYGFPVWLMFLVGVMCLGLLYTATNVSKYTRRSSKSELQT